MTVKMSDCNQYHIYFLFFFSLDPYTLRKHSACFYFLDNTFINKMHHGEKKNYLLKIHLHLWLDMLDQNVQRKNNCTWSLIKLC